MPLATEIYQEGLRLPPLRLVAGESIVEDVLALFLANTRVPAEREGDLMAQWAALRVGSTRVREIARLYGPARLARHMSALQDYSARLMRATLAGLPAGTYRASDVLAGQWKAAGTVDLTTLNEPQGEGVAFGANDTVFLAGEGGGKGQPGTFVRLSCSAPRS